MSLGWKSGLVFLLMIAVGVLMIFARKRNYEGVRTHYTRRRVRVPVERPLESAEPEASKEEPKDV